MIESISLQMRRRLPALVVHPQIVALERSRTDDVGTRIIGRAIAADAVRRRRLAPLRSVERWRQWKRFGFQTDIIQTT